MTITINQHHDHRRTSMCRMFENHIRQHFAICNDHYKNVV